MGCGPSLLKRVAAFVAVILVATVSGIALFLASDNAAPSFTKPVSPVTRGQHNPGGSVRVVVSTPPEYADSGQGGNTLRSLTFPRLFDAQPDGTWRASLVAAGSDSAAKNGRSATFSLGQAQWSDGSSITADDLRRTMDSRFVERVDDANDLGVIKVHFKQKLPGWRMLWSDTGIAPPSSEVSGGPFFVASVESGSETVLKRNETWAGGKAFLDEVRLQYVPDHITAQQLLTRGEVDVVAPAADTARTAQFEKPGVKLSKQTDGGVWTALQFNLPNVPLDTRLAAANAFPRDAFVNALLADEAKVFAGTDGVWQQPAASANTLEGVGLTFSSPVENPLSTPLDAAFSRGLASKGANMNSRASDAATVDRLVAAKTFDVAFVTRHDGPDVCWQCTFGDVDSSLATKADSGDKQAVTALQRKAREQAAMLPLWKELPLVAYRSAGVEGVVANGYANSAAWSAENWWKP